MQQCSYLPTNLPMCSSALFLKRAFLALLFILSVSGAVAQNMIDIVELKNGSVIRGTIVEQVVGESLKIKTYDGSLFVFRMDEVVRITKEAAAVKASAPTDMNTYGGLLGLGVCVGGGGIAGVVVRSSPSPHLSLEVGVSWLPSLTYRRTTYYDQWGNQIRENEETTFIVAPVFSGGIDVFFGQGYKSVSKKIVRNGIMVRGGASLHEDLEQTMVAMGWARERYKEGRKVPSYCLGLGLGAWIYGDPDENPLNEVLGTDFEVLPMIYWKFHWNWYVVKKKAAVAAP